MSSAKQIVSLFEGIASISRRLKKKLIYLIVVGALASFFLAWNLYSQESSLAWNLLKCGSLVLPALVWVFIWSILGQLQEAPALAKSLLADKQGILSTTQSLSLREPRGLLSLVGTLRAFRREAGLSAVLETLGSVGMLANPLFAIIALIALGMLFILIFAALLVLIF